jgi:signal transduction histidine kinase
MDTYFASPEMTDDKEISNEIDIVSNDPVITGLLHSISGILAILDENRQIVAVNDSFLKLIGIDDQRDILGLRPGRVLQCVYSDDGPSGCGTTKYCSTCGAAIAIVSSLGQNIPEQRICALSANRGGKIIDLALLVKSHPIMIGAKRFVLLFLQDITNQQQRAALERTFFHDINNLLTILMGTSELIVDEGLSKYCSDLYAISTRLIKEVAIQGCLFKADSCDYIPVQNEITTEQVIKEIISFFKNHPAAKGKKINVTGYPTLTIKIDVSLLLRVLCNMIINALEATDANGAVDIRIENEEKFISFYVRNSQEMPREVANRIFQRNFSTKEQDGRGTGTFSMKLFGEKILGGKVDFTTSKENGTIFKFSYPV